MLENIRDVQAVSIVYRAAELIGILSVTVTEKLTKKFPPVDADIAKSLEREVDEVLCRLTLRFMLKASTRR
jgi:hypothetical protein